MKTGFFKILLLHGFTGRLAAVLILGFCLFLSAGGSALAEEEEPKAENPEYIQLTGVTDLRSKYSDGCFTLETLAEMCLERKIDVMIVMDHDRYSLEYGIFPFRNIIRKKVEESSLLSMGVRSYLNAFENMKYEFGSLIAIPGVESAPFYYWTGGIFSGDLTANLWENHLSIVGMKNIEDYEGLPTLNSNFTTRFFWNFFPGFFFFFLSALVGVVMIFWGEYFRIGGIAVIVVNLLFMISYHPFRSSPFDQYHGPQGVTPWQRTIDYANEREGMTFWHHLESSSGIGQKGPIKVNTPPHPQDLLQTHGYTGFQAVYEDTITVTDPGREWDQALIQFLNGQRDNAPWGIGGHDYHCEGTSNIRLNDVKTIFLVEKKNMHAVLSAMHKGRMYAVRQSQKKKYRLSLDEFTVQNKDGSHKATMGEAATLTGRPNIRVKISATDQQAYPVTLTLVRMGEKIQEFTANTPIDYQWEDPTYEPGKATYYRLKAFIHGDDYLIANPVFALFQEGEAESPKEKAKEEKPAEAAPPAAPQTPPDAEEKSVPPSMPPVASPTPEGTGETPPGPAPESTSPPATETIDKGTTESPPPLASPAPESTPAPTPATAPAAVPAEAPPPAPTPVPAENPTPAPTPVAETPQKTASEEKNLTSREKGNENEVIPGPSQPQASPPAEAKASPPPQIPEPEKKAADAPGASVPQESPPDGGFKEVGVVEIAYPGVLFRKGPGTNYPELGTAAKGDRFIVVERADVLHQGKPWLKLRDQDGKEAFVWEGLTKTLGAKTEEPLSTMRFDK